MKNLFAIVALVFGFTMFAQAQSSTSAPKKSTQITEAPRPTGSDIRTNAPSSTSSDATIAPSTSTRSSENAPAGSTDAAPAATRGTNTTPTNRVISPDNRVNVNGSTPVPTTQPVVKPNTTVTPKH